MKYSKEIKAGVIAIIAIIGFVILYQFMKGKSLFTSTNVFFVKYDNVQGLQASSKVSINGLNVGQVDKILPTTTKDGKIHFIVRVAVNKDFQFSKKSTVEIFEPGLMSGKEMKINMAYGGDFAKNGDTLQGNYQLSMLNSLSAQVGPVKDQIQSTMKTIDLLAGNANQVLDDKNKAEIATLLISLNKTIASLEGTSKSANSLLSNNDPRLQKVLENANNTMSSANTAVGKYGTLAESIDTKKLNATIADLDATIAKLNNVVGGIENGNGTMGKLLKDETLYKNLESATNNLNTLMIDFKENPKRYINFSVFGKNNKD